MKITRVETIWFEALPPAEWQRRHGSARQALPNNLWVATRATSRTTGRTCSRW